MCMFALSDVVFVGGLILCAVLVLIPTVMIAYIIIGVIAGLIEHRREEARRVTLDIPRLGKVTSTNNRHWQGELNEMQFCIENDGSPPGEEHITRLEAVFANLDLLRDRARKFLVSHEVFEGRAGIESQLIPFAIDIDADGTETLKLSHSDFDGWHSVRFQDHTPIEAGFDD